MISVAVKVFWVVFGWEARDGDMVVRAIVYAGGRRIIKKRGEEGGKGDVQRPDCSSIYETSGYWNDPKG